jgi:hypothetical protein
MTMSALDVRTHLNLLHAERALASLEGLAPDSPYMVDLEGEIEAAHGAFVATAVTEIATLRGELFGQDAG